MHTLVTPEKLNHLLDIPGWLDFATLKDQEPLSLLFRLQALLSSHMFIPSTFLLHNAKLHRIWHRKTDANGRFEASISDIEQLFDTDLLTISIPSADHLQTFSDHWEASNNSNNPSVIPPEEKGGSFARFLDKSTAGVPRCIFRSSERLTQYETLYRDELKDIPDDIVDLSITESLQVARRKSGYRSRKETDGFDGFTRSDLLILLGESRIRPEFEVHPSLVKPEIKNRLLEAANSSYTINAAESLYHPYHKAAVRSKSGYIDIENDQLEILPVDKIIDRLKKDKKLKENELKIDYTGLLGMKWKKIRALTKHDTAREYFNSLQILLTNADEWQFTNTANKLIDYLTYIGSEVNKSGALASARVRCSWWRKLTDFHTLHLMLDFASLAAVPPLSVVVFTAVKGLERLIQIRDQKKEHDAHKKAGEMISNYFISRKRKT